MFRAEDEREGDEAQRRTVGHIRKAGSSRIDVQAA